MKKKADDIIIQDSSERRRFIRRGAAFVAVVGSAMAASTRSALAADCDSGGPGGEKPEHGGNGSDSDAGASADPRGCGRQKDEKPKLSRRSTEVLPGSEKNVSVAKIAG